jgi:hypothetical protein
MVNVCIGDSLEQNLPCSTPFCAKVRTPQTNKKNTNHRDQESKMNFEEGPERHAGEGGMRPNSLIVF